MSYAHYAGFDPKGLINFFEKMDRVEQRDKTDRRPGASDPEWLRTHPLNRSRIERAETVIENKNFRFGQ
jgi:predicted Zn-dependent protease